MFNMFLITRAFENQQYTWKPICWYKCSNKVVNFQLTLSVIGRKQILTWPLSKLIQFTVILFQSNFKNTMCTIHLCKSWNPKFLTHATKSLHRHCIYEMIWWFGGKNKKKKRKGESKNQTARTFKDIFTCLQKALMGEKLTQLLTVKGLPSSDC